MSLRGVATAIALLCTAAAAARAQPAGHFVGYFVVFTGGQQFQIGRGQLLPLQPATKNTTMMSPVGTQTKFPPLLIPPHPNPSKRLVKQSFGPDPRQLTIPPSLFRRQAKAPVVRGVARQVEKVLQVRTQLDFTAPAPALGSVVLKAGGRTGAPTTTLAGVPAGATIRYAKSAAQFGGPAQARVVSISPVQVWINGGAMLPCKHPAFGGANASCVAPLVLSRPASLVAAGAPIGFTVMTPGGPPPTPRAVLVSVPNTTGFVAASVDAMVSSSFTNMATSVGFPWTTGMITLSQLNAPVTPEVFTITGMDQRVNGLGTISLVSGALSERALTGPSSNRGWMRITLPEPSAALGVCAALAALALCHRLARSVRR